MCKIVFSLFLLMVGNLAFSQGGNYLYIDAADGQTFYVKFQGKIHSSSQNGHVIITGIKEKTSDIVMGFPGNSFPEQQFSVNINGNDQGFHLRNDHGVWSLQNLKTTEILPNINPAAREANDHLVKKTDAFSILLAKVVNDSAVLFADSKLKDQAIVSKISVSVSPAVQPAKDTVQKQTITQAVQPAEIDTIRTASVPAKDTVKREVVKTEPSSSGKDSLSRKDEKSTVPAFSTPGVSVRKLFDQHFERKYEATYADSNNGKVDTIKISYAINEPKADNETVITPVKKEAKTIDSVKKDSTVTAIPNIPEPVVNCRFSANDQDVDNLRVRILESSNTDEKIASSKIFFGSKCFTVKQIKGLSELFQGDEDKYRFFDTAYPYILDQANFSSLITLLKEDYYRNRFKAIIRK